VWGRREIVAVTSRRSGSPISHQSGSLPECRLDSIAATAQAMRDSPFPQNFQSSLAERL